MWIMSEAPTPSPLTNGSQLPSVTWHTALKSFILVSPYFTVTRGRTSSTQAILPLAIGNFRTHDLDHLIDMRLSFLFPESAETVASTLSFLSSSYPSALSLCQAVYNSSEILNDKDITEKSIFNRKLVSVLIFSCSDPNAYKWSLTLPPLIWLIITPTDRI